MKKNHLQGNIRYTPFYSQKRILQEHYTKTKHIYFKTELREQNCISILKLIQDFEYGAEQRVNTDQ